MSRTYRDYPKHIYCHRCSAHVPGFIKIYTGVCEHNQRPWTRQHNKRPYKYRNPGKHSSCCQGTQQWRTDLFWLRFDVSKTEGY